MRSIMPLQHSANSPLLQSSIALMVLPLCLLGCVTGDVGSYRVPGESIDLSLRYYLVINEADDHNLHELLLDKMRARNMSVISGKEFS